MPEGKIKRKYVRGKDKKDVANKLAQAIAERNSGIVYDSENMTGSEYLDLPWALCWRTLHGVVLLPRPEVVEKASQ